MSKTMLAMLLGMVLALPAAAQDATQDAAPPVMLANAPSEQEVEAALVEFRDLVQRIETEIVSKSLSLSTEEATAFWPVFQRYQDEKTPIIDAQIASVREYAAAYGTLTEADSAAYVEALLKRDQRIQDLRVKYLAEFGKVLPANKAARVIQISRRVGLAGQAKLASGIPLVH